MSGYFNLRQVISSLDRLVHVRSVYVRISQVRT